MKVFMIKKCDRKCRICGAHDRVCLAHGLCCANTPRLSSSPVITHTSIAVAKGREEDHNTQEEEQPRRKGGTMLPVPLPQGICRFILSRRFLMTRPPLSSIILRGDRHTTRDNNAHHHPWRTLSSSSSSSTAFDAAEAAQSSTATPKQRQRRRLDPMAKRPNQKCDPYGQGGKPMDAATAQSLRATVDDAWQLQQDNDEDGGIPTALVREFIVPDFVQAARLASTVAAAAQLQNHFPRITLDRRIVRKEWQTVVQIQCHTLVLGGLSTHDFHLAMVSVYVRTYMYSCMHACYGKTNECFLCDDRSTLLSLTLYSFHR